MSPEDFQKIHQSFADTVTELKTEFVQAIKDLRLDISDLTRRLGEMAQRQAVHEDRLNRGGCPDPGACLRLETRHKEHEVAVDKRFRDHEAAVDKRFERTDGEIRAVAKAVGELVTLRDQATGGWRTLVLVAGVMLTIGGLIGWAISALISLQPVISP